MTSKLYHGDCLEIMPTLEAGSIDAIITDPPYGIDYQSARRTDKSKWKPKIENDKTPYLEWIPDAYRITKEGGSLICFCRWDVQKDFIEAIQSAGYIVKSEIIWDKGIHGMGDLKAAFAPQHENMIFAIKGKFKFWDKRPHDVIKVNRVSAEKLLHPNEKPVELLEKLTKSVLHPDGIVLDCFAGSGTTGIACKNTGRNFIGIEKDDKYFEIAKQRIGE